MARKASRFSTRKGVSRPLIIPKKNTTFANEFMTSSKNGKIVRTVANKVPKKRERRKMTRPNYKSKQSLNSVDKIIPSKLTRKKRCVSVAKKRIEEKVLRDVDCCADNIEIAQKNESICEFDDYSMKKSTGAMSKAVQETHERVQASLWTTTTNDFPKSWTANMIRYYFEPNEESKNFDYVKIMDNVEYNASDWWISDADRTECRKKKDFFLRCAKCNQKGHTKKDCKKLVVCYMCGEFNHWYPDCPNALCLTCGRVTKKYSNNCRQCRKIMNSRKKCTLCGQIWHEESQCPSKWRKYLMVTRSTPESTPRLNSKKCCYNCAQRGHFGFQCPLVSQSDYPPENPLKTAFPFEQRYISDGDGDRGTNDCNGERDCENSARTVDNGNLDFSHVHVIFLAEQTSNLLSSEMGRRFLTNLSRNTNIRLELFRGKRCYMKLFGDDDVVNYCKSELLKWKMP